MSEPRGTTLPIRERLDLFRASRLVRDLAERLGMPRITAVELTLVAFELGSNVIRHAGLGSMYIGPVDGDAGIEIATEDDGAPIRDLQMAIRDGHDDQGPIAPEALYGRGGIGSGLGAVARATDLLEQVPTETGKRIRAVRYRRSPGGGQR